MKRAPPLLKGEKLTKYISHHQKRRSPSSLEVLPRGKEWGRGGGTGEELKILLRVRSTELKRKEGPTASSLFMPGNGKKECDDARDRLE